MNLPSEPKSAALHLRADENGTVFSAFHTTLDLKYLANASNVAPSATSAATMLVMMSSGKP